MLTKVHNVRDGRGTLNQQFILIKTNHLRISFGHSSSKNGFEIVPYSCEQATVDCTLFNSAGARVNSCRCKRHLPCQWLPVGQAEFQQDHCATFAKVLALSSLECSRNRFISKWYGGLQAKQKSDRPRTYQKWVD